MTIKLSVETFRTIAKNDMYPLHSVLTAMDENWKTKFDSSLSEEEVEKNALEISKELTQVSDSAEPKYWACRSVIDVNPDVIYKWLKGRYRDGGFEHFVIEHVATPIDIEMRYIDFAVGKEFILDTLRTWNK